MERGGLDDARKGGEGVVGKAKQWGGEMRWSLKMFEEVGMDVWSANRVGYLMFILVARYVMMLLALSTWCRN